MMHAVIKQDLVLHFQTDIGNTDLSFMAQKGENCKVFHHEDCMGCMQTWIEEIGAIKNSSLIRIGRLLHESCWIRFQVGLLLRILIEIGNVQLV